jgi:hypothetical protein
MAPCRYRHLSARQRRPRPPCPRLEARPPPEQSRSRTSASTTTTASCCARSTSPNCGRPSGVPRAASGRPARAPPGGRGRRADSPWAGRGPPRSAHGIVSVEFSDGTSGEYDLVVGTDGIHGAVRRLTFDHAGTPARGPSRLALPGAPTPRGHDVVVDAGARHGVSDPATRRRPRVLLLRRRLTPTQRHIRARPGGAAQRAVLRVRGSRRDAARRYGRRRRHPRLGDRGGRSWLLGARARRADRRRSARDLAEHGPRRGDGNSRTHSCTRTACTRSPRSSTPSRRSRPGADPEPSGSAPRPTAANYRPLLDQP